MNYNHYKCYKYKMFYCSNLKEILQNIFNIHIMAYYDFFLFGIYSLPTWGASEIARFLFISYKCIIINWKQRTCYFLPTSFWWDSIWLILYLYTYINHSTDPAFQLDLKINNWIKIIDMNEGNFSKEKSAKLWKKTYLKCMKK